MQIAVRGSESKFALDHGTSPPTSSSMSINLSGHGEDHILFVSTEVVMKLALDSITHVTLTNVSTLDENSLPFPEALNLFRTKMPQRPPIGLHRERQSQG